jgi:hypothetical protein
LLGPTSLGWNAGDDLSHQAHVQVLVFSPTGDLVRSLDGGTVTITPGSTVTGSTAWNGMDTSLTGLVPSGSYTYRTLVTDEAGNTSQSGDSRPVVKAG